MSVPNTGGRLPELPRLFRLDFDSRESDLGCCDGFDYTAATQYLREHPSHVQQVSYKGDLDASNDSSWTLNGKDDECVRNQRFLYSPLEWACRETVQEKEAMKFLRTIRDIDPSPFLLQDNQGALPLDGECILTASIPLLRFLLEIYLDYDFFCPNGVKMTEDNFNPLTYLCGSYWFEDIDKASREILSGRRVVKGKTVFEDNLGIDDDFWARIILLVKAFYHKTIGDEDHTINGSQYLTIVNDYGERTIRFRLLHACAGIDWFPPNMLKLLVAAFPHALLEADEDGNLPIHVAAGGNFHSYQIEATWEGSFEAHSGYQKTTIDILLDANPMLASIPNIEGKLPLELALEIEAAENGCHSKANRASKDGGIERLISTFPRAARVRSVVSGKLPLEIAIENNREWEDGIEALLMANPEAASLKNPVTLKSSLTLAVERETHFDQGIYALLEASPGVVASEDETRCTHDLPMFVKAASEGCSISVIYTLLRLCPNSCLVADSLVADRVRCCPQHHRKRTMHTLKLCETQAMKRRKPGGLAVSSTSDLRSM